MTMSEIDALEAADKVLAKLATENARLVKELGRLRERLPPTRNERIIRQAATDAKLILHLRHADFDVSRRRLEALGLVSGFRYGWAHGLMKVSRVLDADVSALAGLQEAVEKVDAKARYLLEVDAGNTSNLFRLRQAAGRRYLANRYRVW
jgi:plasmid stabilization system protein ParE